VSGAVELFPLHIRAWRATYGTALAIMLAAVLAGQSAQAQTEIQLYWFKNGPMDGQSPYAGVVRDSKGNLYGTTAYGGTFNQGTIYKISKHVRTLLYSFRGQPDGANPLAGLLRDGAGNLYGATSRGGAYGGGTVFRLSETGKEIVLHSFAQSATDGRDPVAAVIRDAKGNLYGTTVLGGPSNSGTVFKVDPAGNETVLYAFTGGNIGTDGASPYGGLIRDAAGNLYGTTSYGGDFTWGTVFKLDPAGNETILHSFAYGADGGNPMGTLAQDSAGNLYGTTQIGGAANSGTIFKVDPAGNESVLFSFTQQAQGADPQSSLVIDAAGNLYGNTGLSGTYDEGVVFKFDPATSTETVLHYFGNGPDGRAPIGALTLDAAGHIYGATQQGGKANNGTVFVIVP
jgi:uncharacterized repeat protein (TIGR03803 family)